MRILAITNLYPTRESPTSGPWVKQQIGGLRDLGLNVKILYVDRIRGGMREYFRLAPRLKKACVGFSPDIVHCLYGGVMASIVTRTVLDRPTVVSFCGSDVLGELLSGPIRKVISYVGTMASCDAAKRANGVVVKSLNLQNALPRSVLRSKIRIIPNGVDLNRFQPLDQEQCRKQLGWDNERLHVLFPANNGDPLKRFGLAISAIDACKRMGFNAELHELKGIPHPEVPIWMNASDVVLLTSLHEGSPNVVKEALACNVPVVSVDVGDVRERIASISGCYLALPTPMDLATQLQRVHLGPRRIAGRTAVQQISLLEVARRLRNFYAELLESRSLTLEEIGLDDSC
ncbi:MAG: glycosyltransferase [Saprospiraceae bacterium]